MPQYLPARLLGFALALVAAIVVGGPAAPAAAQDTETTPPPISVPQSEPVAREITFPVVGPVNYTDTWGACRGTRCSRSHKGVDIFANKLAPLVAANDGVIVSNRLTATTNAGNSVVMIDDDGWRYLYLHLNNDSPGSDDGANPQGWIVPKGLRPGDRVTAGQVIGYLGDSGNAENTPAHVHFEIHPPRSGAVNPTPSVDRARDQGRVIPTSSLASSAAGRAEHEGVIDAWYRALLRRSPSDAELFAWADRFDIGFADRDDLIADLTMAPVRRDRAGTVVRSYLVSLDRLPNLEELRATEARYNEGADAEEILAGLLGSAEFTSTDANAGDAAFVEQIYLNARGREPSDSVRGYWVDQLTTGRSRVEMAAYFAQSYGLKNATWHQLETIQAFRAALDRLPTEAESATWVDHLDRGGVILDIVEGIRR